MSETYELVNDNDEPEERTAAQSAFDSINAALSDSGEDANINIYRQTGSGRESMEFICKYPADLYELGDLLEKISVEYGGGNYRFMLRDGGKLVNNKLITIAEKKKLPLGESSQDLGTNTLAIVEKMMAQNNENMLLLMAKMEQSQPTQLDPHSGMMQTMQMMSVMKEFLAPPPAEKPKSPIEMLREVSEIKNLFETDGGGSSDSNGLLNLASNYAPKLMELVENQQNISAQKVLPSGAPETATKTVPPVTNPMSPHINTLLSFAKVNKDTDETAKLVLTHTKKEDLAGLNGFLLADGCLPSIIKMCPESVPYLEWFIDLRLTLIEYIDKIRVSATAHKEAESSIEPTRAENKEESISEPKGDTNDN